jgi:hypothetical protein
MPETVEELMKSSNENCSKLEMIAKTGKLRNLESEERVLYLTTP